MEELTVDKIMEWAKFYWKNFSDKTPTIENVISYYRKEVMSLSQRTFECMKRLNVLMMEKENEFRN